MKKCLILILIFFVACKKDNPIKPVLIVGTWKWIYTYKDLPPSPTNPLTPLNTGTQELLIFSPDNSWKKVQDNMTVDSGTYSTGHGYYLPYQGARDFNYDSIKYYRNGILFNIGDYYSIINTDTLSFNPYLSGHFSSYTLPHGGSKWWVKQ